jgi:PadR family transcriptional regulator PadR
VPMPRASDDPLAGLPRNFQRPCLLLLIGENPSHGYDLLERLRELGFKQADPGMLYRSLRAMEQEGLVKSDWEVSELGPPRRTYVLSDEGKDWLHAWAGSLRETERILSKFIRRYTRFARDPSRAT